MLQGRRAVVRPLTSDPDQHLSSVTGHSGTHSFVYDADGGRLLRTTPEGRTLYIDGHEITANTDGTTVTATRSYGDRRSGGELDTDRGWIGQIEDDSTDLAYLNARYHDPNIGTFISADPLYDTTRPQSLNPYNYAMSNPASLSDPSGLDPPWTRPGIKKPPLYFQLSYGNTNTGKAIQKAARAMSRASGRSLESTTRHAYNHWQASYSARVAQRRATQTLNALAKANPDPAFWRALAAAGSGEALTLTGMRIANPDPGFWQALAAAGTTGLHNLAGVSGLSR